MVPRNGAHLSAAVQVVDYGYAVTFSCWICMQCDFLLALGCDAELAGTCMPR